MIASYLALAAVVAFTGRYVAQKLGGEKGAQANPRDGIRSFFSSFMAGALFANSIPHFIHGISGEYFPGPFFHNFGKGAATDIINVLWGLFNFGVGYNLAIHSRSTHSPLRFRVLVASGFTTMSLFLAAFFSQGTYR